MRAIASMIGQLAFFHCSAAPYKSLNFCPHHADVVTDLSPTTMFEGQVPQSATCSNSFSVEHFKISPITRCLISSQAFAAKHNLPFTLLSDEGGAVRKEFGIKNDFLGALPGRQTYLLDGAGTVKLVYNNQFMPEKHISETLRVIEKIKPEQTELKDLPKVGLGMIGKIFKNPEQIPRGGKKEDEA
jgi:hypothetical protein